MANREIRLDQAKLSTFWDHITEAGEQTGREVVDIAKEIKTAGIDGVEIRLEHLLEKESFVADVLKEADLSISCIFEFYDWAVKPDYTEAMAQVDAAAKYGAKVILVVPGFLPEEIATEFRKLTRRVDAWNYMEKSPYIQNIKNELIKLVAYASTKGIAITLEDFDGSIAPFARVEELAYFMNHVPGLRYTFDMGNFAYSDEDMEEGYTILQEYISHVHCKDRGVEPGHEAMKCNKGLAAVAVGSGYIPIKKYEEILLAAGYQGYMAVEHFGSKKQLQDMLSSADFLKGRTQ